MACRLIALYVTVEQEAAIRDLFYDKGWSYHPEDLPLDLVKQPPMTEAVVTEGAIQHNPGTSSTVNYFEVQVVQSISESDNETTDYDGETLLSELIDTSQSVEKDCSDNVKVEIIQNAGAFVISDEIVGDRETNIAKSVTDTISSAYNVNVGDRSDTEAVSGALLALGHVQTEYTSTDIAISENGANRYTEPGFTRMEEITDTDNITGRHSADVFTQLKHRKTDTEVSDRLGKTEYIRIEDKNDLERQIKLCTIEEFDDLKTDTFAKGATSTSKNRMMSTNYGDNLVGKRGRPKKSVQNQVEGNNKIKEEGSQDNEKVMVKEETAQVIEQVDFIEEKNQVVENKSGISKVKSKVKKTKRKKRMTPCLKKGKKLADEHKCDVDEKRDKKEVNKITKDPNSEELSMEKYKRMLKEWTALSETDPQRAFSGVMYGYFRRPVDKPTDLDSEFYTAIHNGWYCSNCSLIYKNKIKFMQHRFKTDGKCFYQCDICNKKYVIRSELSNHRKYHTKDKNFVCQFCNGRYTRRHTLNLHIQQNHQHKNPYMCYICGKLFKIRPCLLRHLQYAHIDDSDRMALCSQCPKRFKSVHDLKAHARTHLTENDWPCDICGKKFKTKKYMREHRKIHSQERAKICEVCGKGFFKLEHLKNHSLLHTGAKPYACTVCSYRCTVKCNLVKHMKTHFKNVESILNQKNNVEFKTEYKDSVH